MVDKHLMFYREEQRKYNSNKKKKKPKAFEEQSRVNGNLTVQVNNGYEMYDWRKEGYRYYFVGVQLDGANDNEEFESKWLDFWTDQNFKWSVDIPMLNTKLVKLGYDFQVRIYASKTKNFEDGDMLGEFRVAWNRCYQFPNMFSVYDQFELTDSNNLVSPKLKPVQGRVAIQAKYTPIVKEALDDKDLDKIGGVDQKSEEEVWVIRFIVETTCANWTIKS